MKLIEKLRSDVAELQGAIRVLERYEAQIHTARQTPRRAAAILRELTIDGQTRRATVAQRQRQPVRRRGGRQPGFVVSEATKAKLRASWRRRKREARAAAKGGAQ